MHVAERVPGETDGEEDDIAPASSVEVAQQEEKGERKEGAPLELDVRDLGDAPRAERVHDAGHRRGERKPVTSRASAQAAIAERNMPSRKTTL